MDTSSIHEPTLNNPTVTVTSLAKSTPFPQCLSGGVLYLLGGNLDDPRNGVYSSCIDGSNNTQLIQGTNAGPAFSFSQGLLAYSVVTSDIGTLDVETHLEIFDINKLIRKASFNVAVSYSLSWSPNRQYIAFIGKVNGQSNRLGIVNIETGTTSDIASRPGDSMMTVAWSPAGDHLLYSTIGLQYLKIFEVNVQCDMTTRSCSKTGEIQIKPSKPTRPTEPIWSPDGKSIAAFCGYPTEQKITLCIMDRDGKISKEYMFTERMMNSMKSPAWSPDGQRIAFSADTEDGTRTIFFVSLADGSLSHLPVADNARKEAPVWLP